MQNILIQNVTKSYGEGSEVVEALGPINLKIDAGEFICILGQSGCGKSTLWKILAGLENATSGEVIIDGDSIDGPSHKRGVVFQNHALLPWLSVDQNISLGYKIRNEKVPKDKIKQVLKVVNIEGFEKVRPKQLSGGMAQRVAIARALINEPDVLLMDEPFGALDAFTRLKMQEELIRIWDHKDTIVFITHDIEEALALATKIVVMTPRPGRIGKVIDVPLEHPRERSSDEFIKIRSQISSDLLEITSD